MQVNCPLESITSKVHVFVCGVCSNFPVYLLNKIKHVNGKCAIPVEAIKSAVNNIHQKKRENILL